MPVEKAPTDIAEKQIRNLSAAIPDVEAGVNAVTESPTAKAAENADKAKAGYAKAIDSGKWARNLKAVSLDDWKVRTVAKVGRIAEGITAAREILVKFHEQRNVHQRAINSQLAGMPTRTLPDSIARMTKQVTEMAKFSFDKSK